MTAEVHLRLSGQVDHLRIVWQAAEVLLEAVPFEEDPVQTRYNILLALQEALSNVLRHGYGGATGADWVDVRVLWVDDRVRIELRDHAPAFDPTSVLWPPDVDDGASIPEGGYGIHIIRAVLDDLQYRREADQNVLILDKLLAAVPDEVPDEV
jgi:serine/threonine-protein kinase RsbW